MSKQDRGFASMNKERQREIARKGGIAAHAKGAAHEWTSEEARKAGRKGGMAAHRKKKEQEAQRRAETVDTAVTETPILPGTSDGAQEQQ